MYIQDFLLFVFIKSKKKNIYIILNFNNISIFFEVISVNTSWDKKGKRYFK